MAGPFVFSSTFEGATVWEPASRGCLLILFSGMIAPVQPAQPHHGLYRARKAPYSDSGSCGTIVLAAFCFRLPAVHFSLPPDALRTPVSLHPLPARGLG